MTDLDTAAIRARQEKAHQMVVDLCQGRRDWMMSIPARRDYDPDLVIDASLQDVPALLSELDRLRAERDALNTSLLWLAERCKIIVSERTMFQEALRDAENRLGELGHPCQSEIWEVVVARLQREGAAEFTGDVEEALNKARGVLGVGKLQTLVPLEGTNND